MCRYYRCPKYGRIQYTSNIKYIHVAGVDTGSSTGVSRFQDLINASKNCQNR